VPRIGQKWVVLGLCPPLSTVDESDFKITLFHFGGIWSLIQGVMYRQSPYFRVLFTCMDEQNPRLWASSAHYISKLEHHDTLGTSYFWIYIGNLLYLASIWLNLSKWSAWFYILLVFVQKKIYFAIIFVGAKEWWEAQV